MEVIIPFLEVHSKHKGVIRKKIDNFFTPNFSISPGCSEMHANAPFTCVCLNALCVLPILFALNERCESKLG